jgi:excinuclease ABC subunit A
LEIKYREKNISDILEMSVSEACEFFQNHKQIKRKLETLEKVGLGYIHLGQSATTLSGGEAQRIKLATELSKVGTGNTLYILDEPTTGLHPLDVKLLLSVLHELVERGNTVLVIEHNLDVIKTADWIIDLGPEGGNMGGQIIATGTPEEVVNIKESSTGSFLKKVLIKK